MRKIIKLKNSQQVDYYLRNRVVEHEHTHTRERRGEGEGGGKEGERENVNIEYLKM